MSITAFFKGEPLNCFRPFLGTREPWACDNCRGEHPKTDAGFTRNRATRGLPALRLCADCHRSLSEVPA